MRRDDWLIQQLPVAMTEDDFLVRYLTIFQQVADTVVHQVDNLRHVFDPAVAPDNMVRTMAEWIGIDWLDSDLPERRQREIVRRYSDIIEWRGTSRGITRLLELVTEGPKGSVQVIDTGGVFAEGESPDAPGHVRIDIGQTGRYGRDDLVRIVRDEVPASLTFEMWIGEERIWPHEAAAVQSRGQLPVTVSSEADTDLDDEPHWRPGGDDA